MSPLRKQCTEPLSLILHGNSVLQVYYTIEEREKPLNKQSLMSI